MVLLARVVAAILTTILLISGTPIVQASGPTEKLLIEVPYRSQFDGSPYEAANCGPTSLAMVLGAFDMNVPTASVRQIVNQLQGSWDYGNGTFIDNLAKIASRYELQPVDLFNGKTYRKWTIDLVRSHIEAGHPVIPQVKYPYLPGTAGTSYWGDHYIVLYGEVGDSFLYHDPASRTGSGKGRLISADQLLKAWGSSDEPMAGIAFAPPPNGPTTRVRLLGLQGTGFLPE